MYCQHCGAEMKSDDKFCSVCGFKRPEAGLNAFVQANVKRFFATNLMFVVSISTLVRLLAVLLLPFCNIKSGDHFEPIVLLDYIKELHDTEGVYILDFLLIALAASAAMAVYCAFTKSKPRFLVVLPFIDLGIYSLIYLILHFLEAFGHSSDTTTLPDITCILCLVCTIFQIVKAMQARWDQANTNNNISKVSVENQQN